MTTLAKFTSKLSLDWFKLGQRRFPFRWKITLPFLILGLWLVLGGAFIATRIVFENADERFNNQLLEGGKIAAEWMVQEEDNLLEALRFVAYTNGVPEAVRDYDAEKLRDLTYTIALNKGLEAVEFLDTHGKLIFSMRHAPGGALEDYQFARDGDLSLGKLEFVRKALAADTDERGDKYAGVVQQDRQAFFYVAGPVYDEQGRHAGGILIGLSLKTLLAHMRDQTFARVTFYQADGAPLESLFSPAPRMDPAQAGRILAQQDSASYMRAMRILETNFVELVNPWKARGQDLGLVGVTYAQPAFVNPSLPTRIGMFGFVLVVFILIILLGMFIANAVTRPLLRLTQASQEVSQGNLDASVPLPPTNDEVTDLTKSFITMVDSLKEANAEILDAYESTLAGWVNALELREQESPSHGPRIKDMTVRLAEEVGLRGDELIQIRRGAMLHDIGKIGIPDCILQKPGKLTEDEFQIMKRHTTYAWEFFSKIEYLRPALSIPYCHHEKWDGSGYPRGLMGEEIPLAARVFAIIDVWEAITRDRIYRKAMTREEALQIIYRGRGTHFDPRVVDAFLKILPELDLLAAEPADEMTQAFFEGMEIAQIR